MKHIIVAKVDNKPGVVSRISGLFTRRGYNIESLVTGMTADPAVYHLTISVIGEENEIRLLVHQLARIIEVIDLFPADDRRTVTRELAFIKVRAGGETRSEVLKLSEILGLRVIGMGEKTVVLEATGDDIQLDAARRAFEHIGIEEFVRSGAMTVELD